MPERRHQSFEDPVDVFLDHEAHLDVDLGELRLTVQAQIFVPEAAHDLKIAIEARHHEELLEDLRRLRQGIKLPGVQARGHQEVSGASGRVLDHEGRFDLGESVLGQVPAGGLVNLGANQKVLLQPGAPQVQVAMLEANGLVGGLVSDLEGWGFGAGEDGQASRAHLDVPGRQVGIAVTAPLLDHARDPHAELVAQLAGQAVGLGVDVRLEHDLGDAPAIPQIDEHAAAVIAAGCHPPEEDDLVARVRGTQSPTVVGSLQLGQKWCGGRIGHAVDVNTNRLVGAAREGWRARVGEVARWRGRLTARFAANSRSWLARAGAYI